MDKPPAILYTRKGCHLCEEAHSLLQQHGFTVELVDIDLNQELRERYGLIIPVVVIGGKERFRGRIDPRLLRRLVDPLSQVE